MPAKRLDESATARALLALNTGASPPWQIVNGHLHKTFSFTDFTAAFAFMTAVARHAERLDHHPDWCNSYREVRIDLLTHSLGGISTLDFELAQIIETCTPSVTAK